MNTDKVYNIENGPSFDRLFDAFKYAYSGYCDRVDTNFLVAASYNVPINAPGCAFRLLYVKDFRIISIEHDENDGGQSFYLSGYCKLNDEPREFKAHYNTKSRKGTISLY